LGDEPGLADPPFAADDSDPTGSADHGSEELPQARELRATSDERSALQELDHSWR
jgi:hypothetical protein